jgi:hypothetical protein
VLNYIIIHHYVIIVKQINIKCFVRKDFNFLPLKAIDLEIIEEEDREELFRYSRFDQFRVAPDPPISYRAIFAKASSATGIEITEKDYCNYKKFREYRRGQKYTFSIIMDIIVCKKFQALFFSKYDEYRARWYKTITVEAREPEKDKIKLQMRYKNTECSYLCRISSSTALTPLDTNENGNYIFKKKTCGFSQAELTLYSAFSFAIGDNTRFKLVSDYLDMFANDYNLFCTTQDLIIRMFSWFGDFESDFDKILQEYINKYITFTIGLNDKEFGFIKRFSLFCNDHPGIAKFIWSDAPEFNTKRAREKLAIYIPKRRQAAFISSETFEQLREFIESIKTRSIPPIDRWINELRTMNGKGPQLYDELCEMLEWRSRDPDVKHMISASYDAKYKEAQRFYDKSKLKK